MQDFHFFLIAQLKTVVGTQKNRLTETVLLSTHNICFHVEISRISQKEAQSTEVLDMIQGKMKCIKLILIMNKNFGMILS